MGRKKAVTAHEMFEYLCTLKNEVSYVQAPGGRNLLEFLCEWFGVKTKLTVGKVLDELVLFKLILKERRNRKIFRLKLLSTDWSKAEIPADIHELKPPPSKAEPALKVQPNRKFAVFIDYKNISDGLKKSNRKLSSFYPLLKSILEEGKIIFGFVFVPYHFIGQIPVMELSYKYHFQVVVCPRQIEGGITKDADSVDANMDFLARKLIEHSDLTDVAIFSGDADFHDLANFAFCQQKRVSVIATRESISGRFLQMAKEEVVKVVNC